MLSRTAHIDLPPIARIVPVSRHLVLQLLRVWDVPHDREDAALLVTELVANVVDHVRGQAVLTLELAFSDDGLRIAVVDGSAIRPLVQELSAGPAARAGDAHGAGDRRPVGSRGPREREARLVRAAAPGPVSREG